MQQDAVRTTLSPAEALGAIMDAGVDATAAQMLAAQSAFETAGWTAMWNFNFGNITTNGSDYMILPGNALHFKPYDSVSAGASDFVNYITAHGLLPFAESSDLQGYVNRLRVIGYAGNADYAAYARGMQSWMDRLASVTPVSPAGSSSLRNAAILAIIAAGAYGVYEGLFDDWILIGQRFLRRVGI